MTELTYELTRIAAELRAYIPASDSYRGEYIHDGWAKKIEEAIAADRQLRQGDAAMLVCGACVFEDEEIVVANVNIDDEDDRSIEERCKEWEQDGYNVERHVRLSDAQAAIESKDREIKDWRANKENEQMLSRACGIFIDGKEKAAPQPALFDITAALEAYTRRLGGPIHDGIVAKEAEIARLTAEVERLKTDAARYQFLRVSKKATVYMFISENFMARCSKGLDDAIDAAMTQEAKP